MMADKIVSQMSHIFSGITGTMLHVTDFIIRTNLRFQPGYEATDTDSHMTSSTKYGFL